MAGSWLEDVELATDRIESSLRLRGLHIMTVCGWHDGVELYILGHVLQEVRYLSNINAWPKLRTSIIEDWAYRFRVPSASSDFEPREVSAKGG